MIAYLDANRPNWRTEPLQDVVAWTHETVSVWVDIPWLDFQMWVASFDLRPTITGLISTGTAAQKTAAQYFLDVLMSGQVVSASDARVRAVVDKALPNGAARTALLELASNPVEHWAVMGWRTDYDDVIRAEIIGRAR